MYWNCRKVKMILTNLTLIWIHENIQKTILLIISQSIVIECVRRNQTIATFRVCIFCGNVVVRWLGVVCGLVIVFRRDVVIVVTVAVHWYWARHIFDAVDNQRWAYTILRWFNGARRIAFWRKMRLMWHGGMCTWQQRVRNRPSLRQRWHWMWQYIWYNHIRLKITSSVVNQYIDDKNVCWTCFTTFFPSVSLFWTIDRVFTYMVEIFIEFIAWWNW